MTTTTSPENELARRLLTREADERGAPSGVAAAAERVLAKLHAHLERWFGVDGSQAVMARALDRVRAAHPALGEARIESRGERTLAGLAAVAPAPRPDDQEITEALAAVIESVIALLTRLIGADLVARLLQQTWPDESVGTLLAEDASRHDAPDAPGNPNTTRPDRPRTTDTRKPE